MIKRSLISLTILAALSGCSLDGDDGSQGPAGTPGANGSNGTDGTNGSNGLNSLTTQTQLYGGNANCFYGGVQVDSGLDTNSNGVLESAEVTDTSYVCSTSGVDSSKNFNRIATFPVCSQLDANCDIDTETASEIVAVSQDENTLIYTDSPMNALGFVDINQPASPKALGTLALAGEPTSVAVTKDYALVAINQSEDYINVAGRLDVVDIANQSIVHSIDIGGQPDSVAVSKDGKYAAIVIENERDEDLEVNGVEGVIPQLPAGGFVIVNTSDADPTQWMTTNVDLTGLADYASADPEPEYVDINDNNIAVVTMQENNYIVLVDLVDGSIVNHFSAGSVNLNQIDLDEDVDLVSQTQQATKRREPDGVSWISTEYFVTANEGDYEDENGVAGGSRGFTVFNTSGQVMYDSANTMEHITARVGHYPEGRSGNKGNEPENAEFGVYGDQRFLFVNSERSSLVFVYDVADLTNPKFKQVLPAAAGPEGALAIPGRNLLVVASEEDNRGDKMRSALNIYSYGQGMAQYPTLVSEDRADGTPIPFAALSGLSADTQANGMLYTIEDSAFDSSRIFAIDTSTVPAKITQEIRIKDSNDVLASLSAVAVDGSLGSKDDARKDVFDSADLASMINADKTVNIDPEGIAKASDGGFWVASEGYGTVGDAKKPVNSLNMIVKTDAMGVIENIVTLPDALNGVQLRFGFEGIAEYDGAAYVAFQRAWGDETGARIGRYDLANQSWSFFMYPLDEATSQNGGWVGLSDITSLGNGQFLVLERDNQGGPDAAIKRIYSIDTNGVADGGTLSKTLVKDIKMELTKEHFTFEKVEGMARLANGDVLIINDNDGVDDNSGETADQPREYPKVISL